MRLIKSIIVTVLLFFAAESYAASMTLSWTDNSTNELGFALERCQGAACTAFVEITRTAVNINTATDLNLADGQTYCYRIRAFNKSNTGVIQYSAYSNSACGATPAPLPPPTAPGNLQASPVAAGANIRWRDRSNNESGFQIERDGTVVAQVEANSTTYVDMNLKPGRYAYRGRAVNSGGESPWSNRDRVRVR